MDERTESNGQNGRDDDGKFSKDNAIGESTRFKAGASGNPGGAGKGAAFPTKWLQNLGGMLESDRASQRSALAVSLWRHGRLD